MPPMKKSKYPPLSIFTTRTKLNGRSPFSCLDDNGNNTLLEMQTPTSSSTKKRGRPPKLYYMCLSCTAYFHSEIGRIQHLKSCNKPLLALRTLPTQLSIENDGEIELVFEAEEKFKIQNLVEEKLEVDSEVGSTVDGTPRALCLGSESQLEKKHSSPKIHVHEDLALKDQIDVGKLLTPEAIVHSPDYLFKGKLLEGPKCDDDDENKPIAEASTSGSTPEVLDQNASQIENTKSAEDFPCICKPCSSTSFKSELELMRHVRQFHSYPKVKIPLSEVKKFYDHEDRTVCPICSKPLGSNKTRSTFLTHLRTHSKEKLFACKVCGQKFSKEFSMRTHIKRHIMTKESLAKSGDSHKIIDETEEEADDIEPLQVDSGSLKEAKVNDTLIHRVCYGQDGTGNWVIKWEKTSEYKDSTKDQKSNISTQTPDQTAESFERSTNETPHVDLGSNRNNSTELDDALVTTPVVKPPDLKPTSIVLDSSSVVEQREDRIMETSQKIEKRIRKRKSKELMQTDQQTPTGSKKLKITSKYDLVQRSSPMSCPEPENEILQRFIPPFKSVIKRKKGPRVRKKRGISNKFVYQIGKKANPKHDPLSEKDIVRSENQGTRHFADSWILKEYPRKNKQGKSVPSSASSVTKPRNNQGARQLMKRSVLKEYIDEPKEIEPKDNPSFKKDSIFPVPDPKFEQDLRDFQKLLMVDDEDVDQRKEAKPKNKRSVDQDKEAKPKHAPSSEKNNVPSVTETILRRGDRHHKKRRILKEYVDEHEKSESTNDSLSKIDSASLVTEPRINQSARQLMKRSVLKEYIDEPKEIEPKDNPSFKKDSIFSVPDPKFEQDLRDFQKLLMADDEDVDQRKEAKPRNKRSVDQDKEAKPKHAPSSEKNNVPSVTEAILRRGDRHHKKRRILKEYVDKHEKSESTNDSLSKIDSASSVTEPRINQSARQLMKRSVLKEYIDEPKEIEPKDNPSFKKDSIFPVPDPKFEQDLRDFQKLLMADDEDVDQRKEAKPRNKRSVDQDKEAKPKHDSLSKEDNVPSVTETILRRGDRHHKKRRILKEYVDEHEKSESTNDSLSKIDSASLVTEPRINQSARQLMKRSVLKEYIDEPKEIEPKDNPSFKKDSIFSVPDPKFEQDLRDFQKLLMADDEDVDQRKEAKPRNKRSVDQDKEAKPKHAPSSEKNNVPSVTETILRRGDRHHKKRRILKEYVDEPKEIDPKDNPSFKKDSIFPVPEWARLMAAEEDVDQLKEAKPRNKRSHQSEHIETKKSLAQKKLKIEKESTSWHGMAGSTIDDKFDQAFERSVEGLIQQLEQGSVKRNKKESPTELKSSSGCPKVVGKSGTKSVKVRLPLILIERAVSVEQLCWLRSRGKNFTTSLSV